ncbi:hypothetical protein [Kribbella sp. NPDC049227]|uniref:hypothetical protein n=1 Tax=Kribbella sp. NPDC049227 TaxID=3364113 RepID=UPI003712A9B4
MDPVSLVVAAVVAGAVSGVKDTAAQMVKDCYAKLRGLLGQRGVEVAALERRPDSEAQKAAVVESLSDVMAADPAAEQELLDAAQALVKALRETAGTSVDAVVGVNLARVEAEFIRIQEVRSVGTGVSIQDSKTTGGIDIGIVDAGIEKPGVPHARQ